MGIATTNRVRVGIIRESTFGTQPSNPKFQTLRLLSSGLQGAPKTVMSDELVSDRQVSDLILVGKDVGGDVGFELSVGSHETLIEAALFGTWTRLPERSNSPNTGGITAVSATAYTTAAAGTDQPGTWQQNDIVYAQGFTNSGNNRIFVAAATTSATSVVMTGGTIEASPPSTARLKKIGFQFASGDLVAAIGPNRLTCTAGDFTTAGFVPGMWIKIGSSNVNNQFATAGCNGWARVSAVAAKTLSLDIVPTGFGADTGTSKTVWVYMGDYVRNGTTQYSHSIEQAYLDNGQYQYFTGMVVGQLNLQLEPQAILKGSCSFVGADGSVTGTQASGATAWTPSIGTTDVLNSSSNVARLGENGTPIGSPNYIMGMSVQIQNNLRPQPGVSFAGNIGVGAGRVEVTGNLTTYFGDATVFQKALANTATSLDFVVKDSAGNSIVVDLPRVKLATAQAAVPGSNQDVMVECTYSAIKHPTYGYTIQVQKFEQVT